MPETKSSRSSARSGALPEAPDVRFAPLSLKGPLVLEGQRLPAAVESLSVERRPMIWSDLPMFEAKYGRSALDMVYDLGVHVRAKYQRNVTTPAVVPFDLELLMRLYDRYPSSCSWERTTMSAVFQMVYGDALQGFPADIRQRAQMAYGARFSRLLGRASTVQYRWLVDDMSQGKTGATRRIKNIVSKLCEARERGDVPRQVLESIAVPMWVMRGFDVDEALPAYDPITLQQRFAKGSTRLRARVQARLTKRQDSAVYEGGAFLTEET